MNNAFDDRSTSYLSGLTPEKAARLKQSTAKISIVVTTSLTLSKLVIGILTGSLAIISEALHSAMDMIAALVAFYSIKKSSEPADRDHHYGHIKFESMGAFIEGLIIFVPYIFVLVYAVKDLYKAEVNKDMLGWGMVLMAGSVAANLITAARLTKVAKLTHSIALKGDALHLYSDGITSLALLIALAFIRIFINTFEKIVILDPLFAIVVSIYIIYISLVLLKRAGAQLLDAAPPEESEIRDQINRIIHELPGEIINIHGFRCRGTKQHYFLDFHLTNCKHMTIEESHMLCDKIEERIKQSFPQSDITIHVEPCEDKSCTASRGLIPVCDSDEKRVLHE
jgi:cation diffusion facilitator family transporter